MLLLIACKSDLAKVYAPNLTNLGKILSKLTAFRSSSPEVFLGKGVLKICSRSTGEHPCRSAISIKLQRNFRTCTRVKQVARTSAWMFSGKFAAYFQNTFS